MNVPLNFASASCSIAELGDANECARIEGFVAEHQGSLFQRPAWLKAVEQGTGQEATGLIAEKMGAIVGWLPLTLVHSPIFGRALISSGFGVGGGVLADDPNVAEQLCRAVQELATRCSGVDGRSERRSDPFRLEELV